MKLYHHKTDGGAEYLCTAPVEGTNEGNLSTAVIRLDGQPETLGTLDPTPDLLAALEGLLDCPDLNLEDLEPDTIYLMENARAAIVKAKGITS